MHWSEFLHSVASDEKCLGNSRASKTHGPPICKNRPVPMLIAQPNRPQSKAPKKPMDFNSNSLLQWGSQECLAVMDMYSCDSRYSLGNLEGTAIPSEPDFGLSWSPSCVVAAGNEAANLTGKPEKLKKLQLFTLVATSNKGDPTEKKTSPSIGAAEKTPWSLVLKQDLCICAGKEALGNMQNIAKHCLTHL